MKNVTFTTRRTLSRRTFLKGTGVALALPWLDAMHAALAAELKTARAALAAKAPSATEDALATALKDAQANLANPLHAWAKLH